MTEDRPLAGRVIAVTRARDQAPALVDRLEASGAEVVEFPVIEVLDPEDWSAADSAIEHLTDYDWVVLTSANGVDRFLGRMRDLGRDADVLAGSSVAAVGSATAERLAERGLPPDLVPADFRAEGLVASFRESGVGLDAHILIPRALEARETLPDELRAMGAEVDVVPVYRVVPATPEEAAVERFRAGDVDVVTFASGGTARNFVRVIRGAGLDPDAVLDSVLLASVGPVTTAALARLGHRADIEAAQSTMPALVEAIAERFRGERG